MKMDKEALFEELWAAALELIKAQCRHADALKALQKFQRDRERLAASGVISRMERHFQQRQADAGEGKPFKSTILGLSKRLNVHRDTASLVLEMLLERGTLRRMKGRRGWYTFSDQNLGSNPAV